MSKHSNFAEILGLVAAAGTAALFIRHETGPKPFLKTRMQIGAVAIGATVIAALAGSRGLKDVTTRKGDGFAVLTYMTGAVAIAALFTLTKRSEQGRILTSGGPDVFKAQLGLLRLGYPVPTNGQLDFATREALKRFQATYGIATQDGSLDAETAAYIEQAVHSSLQPQPFSPDSGYHPAAFTQT